MEPEEYWTWIAQSRGSILGRLVRRYGSHMAPACEDAVSDASIRLVQHAARLTPALLPAWLYQAAKHLLIDHYRWLHRQHLLLREFNNARNRRISCGRWAHVEFGVDRSALQHALHHWQEDRTAAPVLARDALEYYLAQLLPKVQQRLLLALQDGNDVTALRLGRTTGAVGAGLWKARRKLQQLRQEEESR